MKSFLVKPSLAALTAQLVAVACCAIGLYSYLQTIRIEQMYQDKIKTVIDRGRQLRRTEDKLQAYQQIIAREARLAATPARLKWEEVAFTWKNIPLSELLHRLDGIYANDRVFVLTSFSFARDKDLKQVAVPAKADSGSADDSGLNQQFVLKGYYLCLCR